MTSKQEVKNGQWQISELYNKVEEGFIKKPKYQRKRKWDKLPKKDNTPNIKDFINFLFRVKNSVHAITFGLNCIDGKMIYENIDGNNRINAIMDFINKPFEIFPEHLKKLIEYISSIEELDKTKKTNIINHFKNIDYTCFINIRRLNQYFSNTDLDDIYKTILCKNGHNDKISDEIENIQTILKIDGSSCVDKIKIHINIFENYSTTELCNTFGDINKFNSQLTQSELLACKLFNETNFEINDNGIKAYITNQIIEFYKKNQENEALICHNYDNKEKMNAYDFIVGFQNYWNNKFNIIEGFDREGLSLFFKIYKCMYGLDESFNNINVNEFIYYINKSCNILKNIIENIFTEQIDNTLFSDSCTKKSKSLKRNNLYVIIITITGLIKKGKDEKTIKKHIEKSLLYHFFQSFLCKDDKELYKMNNSILYEAGGNFIDNQAKKFLTNPDIFGNKITKSVMKEILLKIVKEKENPNSRYLSNGEKSRNKRRQLNFIEKCLYLYYYKNNMPQQLLNNKFSVEHIIPFSSNWEGENIDIDRIGNKIPIINEINSKRSNNHIKKYEELDKSYDFMKFISDIKPTYDIYNKIVVHPGGKSSPKIIDNNEYNDFCKKNEETYINNFVNCLFK